MTDGEIDKLRNKVIDLAYRLTHTEIRKVILYRASHHYLGPKFTDDGRFAITTVEDPVMEDYKRVESEWLPLFDELKDAVEKYRKATSTHCMDCRSFGDCDYPPLMDFNVSGKCRHFERRP